MDHTFNFSNIVSWQLQMNNEIQMEIIQDAFIYGDLIRLD